MTKSIEEQAREYVESKICFNGLEYSVGGNTYNECFRSFLVGAKARDAQWSAVVNELMTGIEFDLNYHACRTGDCPHEKQSECDKSIIDSTKELLIKADQMLKEMGVESGK